MDTTLKVKIIAHTPEPEKVIASSAKLCYSSLSGEDLYTKSSQQESEKFIQMLMRLGHESPIEHVSFTFSVEGVSRILTHQLVRHRIASYSQRSQRYVKEGQFQYIIPPEIKDDENARRIFVETMEQAQKSYDQLTAILFQKHQLQLMKEGHKREHIDNIAEKRAIEDARFVLPNACETKIMLTMNARTLLHFFSIRCCRRAQWEIRELAIEMLKQARQIAPALFRNAGPGCLRGPCPEGKMTCGHIDLVRKEFSLLQID